MSERRSDYPPPWALLLLLLLLENGLFFVLLFIRNAPYCYITVTLLLLPY
ncbi:MAG: hypothetical protein IJT36_02350 [Alphaproteobacteria bacterium]|nr:hypothetical protein [Alphaproteobacteria bacterium]